MRRYRHFSVLTTFMPIVVATLILSGCSTFVFERIGPSEEELAPTISALPKPDGPSARIVIARIPDTLYWCCPEFVSIDDVTIARLGPREWTDSHVSLGKHKLSVHWFETAHLPMRPSHWWYEGTFKVVPHENSIEIDITEPGDILIWFHDWHQREGGWFLIQVKSWPKSYELKPRNYVPPGSSSH